VAIALVGVADAQASSTAPASNTTSTASRRALQQTPARSGRCLATDGRAPASAVVDPLVPASRSPPAQASLDVSARERRRSSDAYQGPASYTKCSRRFGARKARTTLSSGSRSLAITP